MTCFCIIFVRIKKCTDTFLIIPDSEMINAELKPLPEWAKHYEEKYNLNHIQEVGFVKALISLDTIAKQKPEIANKVNGIVYRSVFRL